jgi:alpha-glucosidase (family GH31 glycosyl hydrolase)
MYRLRPKEAEAYSAPQQYFFGEDIVVAPVSAPAAAPGEKVPVKMWVPSGESSWVDFYNPSRTFPAGSWITYSAGIDEVPVLVRGGAIIPTLPRNMTTIPGISGKQYSSLQFAVYPGSQKSTETGIAYEDDGYSTDYLSGISSNTSLTWKRKGACTEMTITTIGKTYRDMVQSGRRYSVVLLATPIPTKVEVNHQAFSESTEDGVPGTYFRTSSGDSIIYLLPTTSVSSLISIAVC